MKPKMELALSVSTYDGHPPKRPLGARVADDTCVVGRDTSCQLALPDPEREISGQHLLIYRQNDGFAALDVSRNGTFLNEAEEPLDPSQPVELRHGDRLTIGRYVVEVGFLPPADALAQTAQVRELGGPPDEPPRRSHSKDILDYISADSTQPAVEPPSQPAPERPSSGTGRSRVAATGSGSGTSGAVVSGPAPIVPDRGDARVERPSGTPSEGTQARNAPPQTAGSPMPPSPPDPADAPTTLIALADGPLRDAPEATDSQRATSARPAIETSGAQAAREAPLPSEPVDARTGAEAADAPTQIIRIVEAPIGVASADLPTTAGAHAGDDAPDREPSPRAETEAEPAAVRPEARQDPSVPQAPEACAESPASGGLDPGSASDPGRTMEGPSRAAKLGQAPVLDDATRIRCAADEPPARPLSPSERRQVEAFLAELGAGHPDEIGDAGRLMRASGRLLRAMTQGLVTLSMAQGRFDSELRGEMPPAPPGAVNPFRFCVDLEDTLARVLWRPGRGDLDPSLAARQAFEDLEVHQAALMAGFHAVLKALLARLEPHAIEQEVAGRVGLSQLRPNARKAACWESYMKSFEEVADDLADDFPKLMGEVFGHAYDDQSERLRAVKRRR